MGTASKYDGGGLRQLGGRPCVGVVFVLDVSGSMGGRFYRRDMKEMRRGADVDKVFYFILFLFFFIFSLFFRFFLFFHLTSFFLSF